MLHEQGIYATAPYQTFQCDKCESRSRIQITFGNTKESLTMTKRFNAKLATRSSRTENRCKCTVESISKLSARSALKRCRSVQCLITCDCILMRIISSAICAVARLKQKVISRRTSNEFTFWGSLSEKISATSRCSKSFNWSMVSSQHLAKGNFIVTSAASPFSFVISKTLKQHKTQVHSEARVRDLQKNFQDEVQQESTQIQCSLESFVLDKKFGQRYMKSHMKFYQIELRSNL